MTVRRLLLPIVALALLVTGCSGLGNPQHRPAEVPDDGVQLTGRLGGSRVAISDGLPEVIFDDCAPDDGIDQDACWTARTIDGLSVTLVIENPAAFEPGRTLEVIDPDCDACDEVTDGAIVAVATGDGPRRRATSGRVQVTRADERLAATIDLRWPGGDNLTGSFNVRELRPEER